MSKRLIARAILCSMCLAGVFSLAHALTQEELVRKLEGAGYSQVREIKPTPKGIAVKATKEGKDVSLVVDSSGQFTERK
jgi:hypothetical protein